MKREQFVEHPFCIEYCVITILEGEFTLWIPKNIHTSITCKFYMCYPKHLCMSIVHVVVQGRLKHTHTHTHTHTQCDPYWAGDSHTNVSQIRANRFAKKNANFWSTWPDSRESRLLSDSHWNLRDSRPVLAAIPFFGRSIRKKKCVFFFSKRESICANRPTQCHTRTSTTLSPLTFKNSHKYSTCKFHVNFTFISSATCSVWM